MNKKWGLIHKALSENWTTLDQWQTCWTLQILAQFGQQIQKMEFSRPIQINREFSLPTPNYAFSAKIDKFRQFWHSSSGYFAAEFSRYNIGSKLAEFSNEIQTHLSHMAELFEWKRLPSSASGLSFYTPVNHLFTLLEITYLHL